MNRKLFETICLFVFYLMSYAVYGAEFINSKNFEIESRAKAALSVAIEDVRKRFDRLPENFQIRYLRKQESKQYETFERQFVLSRSSTDAGKPVGIDAQDIDAQDIDAQELRWREPVLVRADTFDPTDATLVRETDKTWIFSLPAKVGVNWDNDSDDAQKAQQEVSDKLLKVMQSELVVTKASPRLLSLQIFTNDSFSPTFLANVEKFNVRIEYKEAWPDGPWVHHITTREVAGSYALLMSIDEFDVITNHEFQLTNQGGE